MFVRFQFEQRICTFSIRTKQGFMENNSDVKLNKTKGSGEHWLRPVIRAIASEPRRSLAIRAWPLPDSTLLAGTGGLPAIFRGRPIPRRILSSLSPPARRHSKDAHGSEGRQSLHCLPSELFTKCISRSKPRRTR
jgi:hypothetical protein